MFSWARGRKAQSLSPKRRSEPAGAVPRWMNTLRRLGAGGFGCVYEGIDVQTGEIVALKHLGPRSAMFHHEVDILSHLAHPNVVRYVGSFSEAAASWIVMEYCSGGSLGALLERICVFPVGLAQKYLKGVLLGLEYLHSRKLAHCDIKPDNILLLPDGTPKLSDFGLSHGPGSSESSSEKGSLRYQPPEGGNPTFAADVWALGITLLEMLNGVDHHGCHSPEGDVMPAWLPGDVQDFLRHCLERDPAKRWTASQLLQHPFMKGDCREAYMRKPFSPSTTMDQLQRLMDLTAEDPPSCAAVCGPVMGMPQPPDCLPGQLDQAWGAAVPRHPNALGLKQVSFLR